MFVHVKIWYQKCPDCGSTWSTQLSPNDQIVRIGKEIFTCNCGKEWQTGRIEWSRLSPDARKSYFFSSAEIGMLVISSFVPPLFGYFIGGWGAAYKSMLGGLVFGIAFVLVLWIMKAAIVKWSLRRCPHTPGISPTGGWPWNW